MIGKLSGIVEEIGEDYLILNVNNVGYLVHVASKLLSNIQLNSNLVLFIETHVREDNIQLFGFTFLLDKKSFILLTSVAGVGPRVALAILNLLTPEALQLAISNQNLQAFIQVPGIGKKLAERIILELKGKVANNPISRSAINVTSSAANDAILALNQLGINYAEAAGLVNTLIMQEGDLSSDQIIKLALQKRT